MEWKSRYPDKRLPWPSDKLPAAKGPTTIRSDEDLWNYVHDTFGVSIPRVQVCPNHVAPFTAFAHAFFARSPICIWKASRGLGGKSFLLALLAVCEQIFYGADVTVLGGSGQQSANVVNYSTQFWYKEHAPRYLLMRDPATTIVLVSGARMTALTASQKSVRGPHPQRMRLDEVDEMDVRIFDAAQGQTLAKPTIPAQTVISSTHQYPDKTMAIALARAAERGWEVFEWCWQETVEPHGWLPKREVERKRTEVNPEMWRVEFDLQEPSFEGRAFNPLHVDRMFDQRLGLFDGADGQYIEIEPPQLFTSYVHGVDWAKDVDYTVICTYRADLMPWKLVAFLRIHRQPWPQMIARINRQMKRYPGVGAHDATGIGDVTADYLESVCEDIKLGSGRGRNDLFNDYVIAVESDKLIAPRISYMYTEHKYCSNEALFYGGHPPDSVVASAMCWSQRHRVLRGYQPETVGERTAYRADWRP